MTTRIDTMPLPSPRRVRLVRLPLVMLFLASVALADALFADSGFGRRRRAERDYVAASQALRAIRTENAGLREQIRRLQSDPAAIEALARQDLGLIRSGEILFLISGPRP